MNTRVFELKTIKTFLFLCEFYYNQNPLKKEYLCTLSRFHFYIFSRKNCQHDSEKEKLCIDRRDL